MSKVIKILSNKVIKFYVTIFFISSPINQKQKLPRHSIIRRTALQIYILKQPLSRYRDTFRSKQLKQ